MQWMVRRSADKEGLVFISETRVVRASPEVVFTFKHRRDRGRGPQQRPSQRARQVSDEEFLGEIGRIDDVQRLEDSCCRISAEQYKRLRWKVRDRVCEVLMHCDLNGLELRHEHRGNTLGDEASTQDTVPQLGMHSSGGEGRLRGSPSERRAEFSGALTPLTPLSPQQQAALQSSEGEWGQRWDEDMTRCLVAAVGQVMSEAVVSSRGTVRKYIDWDKVRSKMFPRKKMTDQDKAAVLQRMKKKYKHIRDNPERYKRILEGAGDCSSEERQGEGDMSGIEEEGREHEGSAEGCTLSQPVDRTGSQTGSDWHYGSETGGDEWRSKRPRLDGDTVSFATSARAEGPPNDFA